jgi:hypothetical protein
MLYGNALSDIYLAAVDHRNRFVELYVGWPGSVADGRIWSTSALKANLETFLANIPSVPVATRCHNTGEMQYEHVPAFILLDSAYPSTSRTVPTFRPTECRNSPSTKRLNQKLSSIRYCIEQAFGICKGRFRLFGRPLECAKDDVTRATKLIIAIFTLHNFLIDEDDLEEQVEQVEQVEEVEEVEEVNVDGEDVDADIHEGNGIADEQDFSTRNILLRYTQWLMQ